MKRFIAPVSAVACSFLVLTVAACDGEIPAAPDAVLAHTDLDAKAYPATHSVTGQGTTWSESGQQWFIISLNARLMPDGTAKGNFHWQYRSREPGGRIFVKVSCLAVVGNEAWILGQASQAGNEANVGKWMGVHVVDYGEGRDAPPDEIYQRWFGPSPDSEFPEVPPAAATEFCPGTSTDGPDPRALMSGNIQVH